MKINASPLRTPSRRNKQQLLHEAEGTPTNYFSSPSVPPAYDNFFVYFCDLKFDQFL